MRAARTRAWPRSISRVCANFRPAGDRSSGLTRPSSSRAFGPITEITLHSALTSVSTANSCAPMWRRIQSASRTGCAEPVTIRKLSGATRITVRSLSKPPRSIEQRGVDHAVHRHVDLVGAQPLQHGQGVAALQQQLAEAALVVDRHRLARGALLLDHPVQPAGPAQAVVRPRRGRRGLEVVGALPAVLRSRTPRPARPAGRTAGCSAAAGRSAAPAAASASRSAGPASRRCVRPAPCGCR